VDGIWELKLAMLLGWLGKYGGTARVLVVVFCFFLGNAEAEKLSVNFK